jgi:hypothetical protein
MLLAAQSLLTLFLVAGPPVEAAPSPPSATGGVVEGKAASSPLSSSCAWLSAAESATR